jgi:hypothetical protein
MKPTSISKSLFTKFILGAFLLTFGAGLKTKENPYSDLKDFTISIEKTDKGIKMQSAKGSAWIDLGFGLPYNKPQAIDEFGMADLGKISTHKDTNLADYLFTITQTKDGIVLTGIEGTAWKELSFPLPKNGKTTINQFGMTE